MSRRARIAAVVTLVAACVAHPALGAVDFGAPVSTTTPGPGAGDRLVAADLDGDCSADLVNSRDLTTIAEDPSANRMLGNGAGGFHAVVGFTGGQKLSGLALADLNRDGVIDLVTTENFEQQLGPFGICASEFPMVPVFFGDGLGGFVFQYCLPAKDHPSAVVIADFYEDGRPDILVGNAVTAVSGGTSAEVVLFQGVGDGTFRAVRTVFSQRADDLAVSDFDGDGHLDVAVASRTATYIFRGSGTGTFPSPGTRVSIPSRRIASVDVNGDGAPDLATVASVASDPADDLLWIAINNGNGTFTGASSYAVGLHPVGVAGDDLDRDGYGDVVVANNLSDDVTVWLGSLSGTLAAGGTFPAGADPTAIVVADFDNDGHSDLAVSNRNVAGDGSLLDGTISMLLQNVAAPLEVATVALPDGEVGLGYGACLQARGGVPSHSWSLALGSLPSGLGLNAATGRIQGVPDTAGPADFTARVQDSDVPPASASAPLRITVLPAAPGPPSGASEVGLGMTPMIVSAYDKQTGLITIQYEPGCRADDHAVHAGPVSALASYGYDRSACGLGTSGTASVDVGAGSRFFVIAARTGRIEGSAGTDAAGQERPGPPSFLGCYCEQRTGGTCP